MAVIRLQTNEEKKLHDFATKFPTRIASLVNWFCLAIDMSNQSLRVGMQWMENMIYSLISAAFVQFIRGPVREHIINYRRTNMLRFINSHLAILFSHFLLYFCASRNGKRGAHAKPSYTDFQSFTFMVQPVCVCVCTHTRSSLTMLIESFASFISISCRTQFVANRRKYFLLTDIFANNGDHINVQQTNAVCVLVRCRCFRRSTK